MLERMKKWGENIQTRLLKEEYATQLDRPVKKAELIYQAQTDIERLPDPQHYEKLTLEAEKFVCYPHYLKLLAIACTFGLQEELNTLLSTEDFKEGLHAGERRYSNRPLIDRPLRTRIGDGYDDTMLGLAAFHGHENLVKSLVRQKADVNAVGASDKKQTPLHQAVRGDSAPSHHSSFGTQHAQVAQYLIEHKADLTAKNGDSRTPLEEAQRAAPSYLPWLLGENSERKTYCADEVRHVLEKAQKVEAGSTTGMLSSLMNALSFSNPLAVKVAKEDQLDVKSSVPKQIESDEDKAESKDEFVLVFQSDADAQSNSSPPPLASETDKDVDTHAPDSPIFDLDANLAVASLRRRRN